jgi:hypothetical protein
VYIGVVSVYVQYNCVYYCDTWDTAYASKYMGYGFNSMLLGVKRGFDTHYSIEMVGLIHK